LLTRESTLRGAFRFLRKSLSRFRVDA
jgi:hypothetical protein